VIVTLTEKGHAAKEKAACIPTWLLENIAVEPEEYEQLKRTLMKMLHSLHEQNTKDM